MLSLEWAVLRPISSSRFLLPTLPHPIVGSLHSPSHTCPPSPPPKVSGVEAVMYYTPFVFERAGLCRRRDNLAITLTIGFAKTMVVVAAARFLDGAGRRRLLLVSLSGMTVSLFAIGIGFFSCSAVLDIVGLFGFVIFFSVGMGPICWLFASEILPLNVRAKGMMLAASANRLVSALVALSFLSLSNGMGGPGGVFMLFAAFALVSLVFTYLVVPETKGRTLEDMGALFDQVLIYV